MGALHLKQTTRAFTIVHTFAINCSNCIGLVRFLALARDQNYELHLSCSTSDWSFAFLVCGKLLLLTLIISPSVAISSSTP